MDHSYRSVDVLRALIDRFRALPVVFYATSATGDIGGDFVEPLRLDSLPAGWKDAKDGFGSSALATGLLWATVALHLCLFVEASDLAWWVSVLLTHVALAVTAGPAYYRSMRSGGVAGKWSCAITYPLFLAVLVMAGLITLDHIVHYAKRPAPEASAISSVHNLVISQQSYSATIGGGTYAASLGSLSASKLIWDSVLASGSKDGYTFTVLTGAKNATFAIYARPMTSGVTGIRSFFTDETGEIRATTEDRPATSEDLRLFE